MEITPGLLKKYARGQCTEAERQAIQAWLDANDTHVEPVNDEAWQQADAMLWQQLSTLRRRKNTRVIPLYKTLSRYAAASFLLIAFSGAAYFAACRTGILDSQIVLNTGSKSVEHVLTSGIDVTLFSHSDVTVKSNLCETKSSIQLCGKLEILIADESRKANLTSLCYGKTVTRTVHLKKGHTYFVFTENEKIMVVDYHQLKVQMSPLERDHVFHKIAKLKVS